MPNPGKRNILKSLEVQFEKGQIVFEEGAESREMYILLAGEVEIRKGGRKFSSISDPDTYLGEMSMLLGLPRTATLVATRDCRMIRVPENKVTDFFAYSPALGMKLAKILATRLHQMNVKYERLLEGATTAERKCERVFAELVETAHCRAFLEIYCQKVGQEMPLKKLIGELRAPLAQVNEVLALFGAAGLVRVHDQTLKFREAPDAALRTLILNWSPS